MIGHKAIALTKLYEASMHVCGDVIECGIGPGDSFSWWIQTAETEDRNPARHFYGFDTFEGFPSVSEKDGDHEVGEECHECDYKILEKNSNTYLGGRLHKDIARIKLIKGDVCETIPQFVKSHPWVIPALVYLDVDLYEPTLTAMLNLVPRMPKGAILAFDQVGFVRWPGETMAMYDGFEQLGIPFNTVALQRCPYYLASAVIIGDDTGKRIWPLP